MYVWARFIHMLATANSRGPYKAGEASRLWFRCMPSDVDFNLHMNNAKYPMLADVGRIDIFKRSGMLDMGRKLGWAPIMGGVQCVFIREIKLWQKFELVSTIETWDGAVVLGRHRFLFENGDPAAFLMTTAGVYDRRGKRFMPLSEVMDAVGMTAAQREPTEAEHAFMTSHRLLRDLGKVTAK